MTFAVFREALVVSALATISRGRRASHSVKARFGADTGPTRDCRRRRAIRPIEASKVAICNGRFTSICDIQSLATNVRKRPKPCGASIDWYSYVVS
jgi:hypothetical protein